MKSTKIFIAFTFLLAFAVCVSAQDGFTPSFPTVKPSEEKKIPNPKLGEPTPSELEGYKFFNGGILNKLKLGISTKEDVRSIFGTKFMQGENSDFYNYDSNWSIQFVYFDEKKSLIVRSSSMNGKQTKFRLVPATEYIGKLSSIILSPKKAVSFSQTTFPNIFNKQSRSIISRKNTIEYDFYEDSYGLEYTIFNKVIRGNLEEKESYSQSDLIRIKYAIPRKLQEKIFVEQK